MYAERMQDSTPKQQNDYCAELVLANNRLRFMQALWLPQPERSRVLCVLALDCELSHVQHAVREEMIAAIRYRWWHDGLEALQGGHTPPPHPLFDAFSRHDPLPWEAMQALVEAYAQAFPALPANVSEVIDAACLATLAGKNPLQERWRRAGRIIVTHRAKHGEAGRSLLALKLLCAGMR